MNSSILFSFGCMHTKSSGPYVSLMQTAKNLRKSGHQVTVLGTGPQETCDVSSIWEVEAYAFRRYGPLSMHFSPGIKHWLDSSEPKWNVASLQGVWLYPNAPVANWCNQNNVPYMIAAHGAFNSTALKISAQKKWLASRTFLRSVFKNATCYQALSEIEYRTLRKHGITKPICIIGNGVELPDRGDLSPIETHIPMKLLGRRTCLYLGRLHPIKGIERLLQAWVDVKPSDDEWQLIVAGDGETSYRSKLEDYVIQHGVKNVEFVGYVEGDIKSAWLRKADFFVLPSYSEGFPMAVLESLAFGTPVLMTASCGFPEAANIKAALEVESSVEGITNGLEEILSISQLELKKMGERGFTLIQQKYDWKIICSQLANVYSWMRGLASPPDCLRFD